MEQKKVVSMFYEARDADTREVVDSNLTSTRPFEFLLGSGQVISGLECAVINAKRGDRLHLFIEPDDAYGVYRTDFVQEVPKDQFDGIILEKGMTLFGQSEDGQTVQVIVKDFNDSHVVIDYNHILAGKTLLFDVEIVDVRDATPDEVLRGCSGGGCCGGGSSCGTHHDEDERNSGGCCGGGCGCH